MNNKKSLSPLLDPTVYETAEDPVAVFCEELLKATGLDQLPEDFKGMYTVRLQEEVLKRIGAVALINLSTKDAEDLLAKMNQPKTDSNEIIKFLQAKIKDFNQKMARALDEFAETFISSAQRAAKAQA